MERIVVEVVVNHGSRRRGERLETAATEEILGLVEVGYLKPLGAASPDAEVEPEIVIIPPEPAQPEPTPPRRPRRGRRVPD